MATEPWGPSDRLITVFRACSRDPTEAIKARLKRILRTFLLHHRDNVGNERNRALAAKCCCQARFWYYRILEDLVGQEGRRLGVSCIPGILEDDLVQCCLVACCLEITISSNSLPCDFPLLLQILNMVPYDFCRIIELVLRTEVGLPRTVVQHLRQVEEKVVESLAWSSPSPLWEDIRANEGHLPTCQQVMPPAQLEDPNRTDLRPDPNLPRAGAGLGAAADRPRRSRPLHLFARKVYSLMGRRLRELCSSLDISEELRLKIWTCFEYSLVHCNLLMVDRHLDQLLMCAIYIIAKITRVEIPFKHIMRCYKSQSYASRSVCNNVLISGEKTNDSPAEDNNNGDHGNSILTPNTPSTHYPGSSQEHRGNLIYFYNQVYSTKMQHFAKQFAQTSGGDTPPLSPYPRERKASPRRRQLSSSPAVYISPYNAATPAPRATGLSYYFNSSPPERLREINNMIRTGRTPRRRRRAPAAPGEENGGGDAPPARRLRLDDESAWQRRLRDVVSDRAARRNQERP